MVKLKKKHEKETIGGQAVIEGVMLMSAKKLAVSVWKGNKIILMKKNIKKKNKLLKLFFIRGISNMVSMLSYGIDALMWSANMQQKEEIKKSEMAFTFVVAMLFTVLLFIAAPFFLTRFVTSDRGIVFNLIDGLIRIIFFILYVAVIGLMPDVKRLFQYHGAEHKVVNCYESGKEVNIGNAERFSTIHLRCGTNFIMIVLVVSILVFSVIRAGVWYWNILLRILLIPVIIGVSYEIIKLGAKFHDNVFFRVINSPGVVLQKITTREPNKKQIAAAINSFRKLME